MNVYLKQAGNFLTKTKTTVSIEYLKFDKYFMDDKQGRDIYKITVRRDKKKWVFNFGQSIIDTGKKIPPTIYDILSALVKYDVGTFDEFCAEFGYNERKLSDYPEVRKIYAAVRLEYRKICDFYTEKEQEELREIQ